MAAGLQSEQTAQHSTATSHRKTNKKCCRSQQSPPEIRLQVLTCITVLDELGGSLQLLARPPVNLGLDLRELASNVGCVAVQHWSIAVANLARVVHDDDL